MIPVVDTPVGEITRDWGVCGFRRAFRVVEYVTQTIGCAVLIGNGFRPPIHFEVEREAESFGYAMRPPEAEALGNLLVDAGLLAVRDPDARAEALGRKVRISGAHLFLGFGAQPPLSVTLFAVPDDGTHVSLRLAPEDAVGVGLLLLRAAWTLGAEAEAEAAAPSAPDEEAA